MEKGKCATQVDERANKRASVQLLKQGGNYKQVPQRDGAQLEGRTPLYRYTTLKIVKLESEYESKVLGNGNASEVNHKHENALNNKACTTKDIEM